MTTVSILETVKPPGCVRTYTQPMFRVAARSVMRHRSRVTGREARQLHRFIWCAQRPASRPVMRRVLGNWRRWRRSYRGYWRLRAERVPRRTAKLVLLVHSCESVDWYLDGHHDGGLQYDVGTWAEAQAWDGTPARYRRAPAYNATRDHQVAVTAAFMPSHLGRWTASRSCWGPKVRRAGVG